MDQRDQLRSLIKRARRGERPAFDDLTAATYDRARSLVLHLLDGNPAIVPVDDILQETFLL